MRTKLLTLAAAFAVAFSFSGRVFADGEGCCEGEKAAAKKDGCCEGKKDVKTKDDCKEGTCCEGKDKAVKTADTAKKDEKKAESITYTLKVTGMTCEGCSKALSKKLGESQNISDVSACHEAGCAKFTVAAGKSIKISDIEKSIAPKFKLDDSAEFKGIVRLTINGPKGEECSKAVCGKAEGLKLAKIDCSVDAEKKIGIYTFCAKNGTTLKALRTAFEGSLAEIELVGGCAAGTCEKGAEKTKS